LVRLSGADARRWTTAFGGRQELKNVKVTLKKVRSK
jgi:hypothetical protein